MKRNELVRVEFVVGERVRLVAGTYGGTCGRFEGVCADPGWAQIREDSGRVRNHPMEWLEREAPREKAAAS